MQLPNDFAALNSVIAKLPLTKIAKAVIIIALVYIAYVCAQLTWQLTTDVSPINLGHTGSKVVSQEKSSYKSNVDNLIALNLFGKATAPIDVNDTVLEDVPETKLKLTLSGVVASSDQGKAAAVIEHNGAQETYGIGDKITNTRATLEKVHVDRVIIKQSGRMETLMLDGFDYHSAHQQNSRSIKRAPKKKSPSAKVIDHRDNQSLLNQARLLKQDVINNPSNIAAYLTIRPARVDNKVVGYKLSPGENSGFFKASGLKSGDVAIQMNGLDLTENSQARQALQLLKSEQEISLLVDRNGELTEILFSIENQS